ncbi:OTU domain-containing protein [Panicum miliaceum]|uniref:Ubiquitin thioesterase OTU n=1 Tax=Panicum miliaceum TaxID=4540 RepID=A0A3L6SM68_PANMI|nr:OTU domain-containing protein [Panicum miliaceum]
MRPEAKRLLLTADVPKGSSLDATTASLLACSFRPPASPPGPAAAGGAEPTEEAGQGIGGPPYVAARRMSDRELRPLRSIRITGDGRCLFRSVAYGACLRRGKQSPSDSAQKELADELRAKVADEFVKRRGDTEWFLEGDFESYVRKMRKPHAWGGEPELLMCSHVLRMPITVYMYTSSSDSPRIIAEYGQEYGKDNPVRVLYDGYGHYDALQPSLVRTQSRLRGV